MFSELAKELDFMTTTSVNVGSKYQITIPQIVREKLNIKKGDRFLVDVQDGVIVLIPKSKRYTSYLQGLHYDIWKDVNVQNYINGERRAWTNSASE